MAELTPPAELTVRRGAEPSGVPVLLLHGELDSSNVALLEAALAQALVGPPASVAFDLAGLRFMDSAGIAVLVSAAAQVALVEIRSPSPIIRRVLDATGLTALLRITP
jgi:anti-anti-sigma factor